MYVVAHNISSIFANRTLGMVTSRKAKSAEKLSSGYRINRSADDAAGLSISEKMRKQIRGLTQGSQNLQDGISMAQIADGALAEVNDMLHRLTELSVKSANGTLSPSDRQDIHAEASEILKEIDRIGKTTKFNELKLFDDLYPNRPVKKEMTDLVACPSLTNGHRNAAGDIVMSEGIQYNGQWRNGATLDFSGINSGNIDLLVGKGFTFTCTQSCQESFQFIFEDDPVGTVTVDGQNNNRNPHIYHIGIGGISNGAQLVNAIFDGVYNNPVNNATYANNLSLSVSHSNIIVRPSVNSATFSLIGSVTGSSKENAASKWQNYSPGMGVVDCDSLTGIEKRSDDRRIWLQASDNNGDGLNFVINRMNSKTIGVNGIDLTTIEGSRQAIDTITHGLRVVGMERASIGAQQNRLEHSIKNIDNVAENTSAAESRIRDTDMAGEMVKYSKDNILQQAGQAMLVQANQANQGVLSLLQ